MQLYIMRHGEAHFSQDQQPYVDAKRPLTTQGEQEVLLVAEWLSMRNIEFIDVFVSPFLRAQQTKTIVLSKLVPTITHIRTTTLDFITPSGSAREVHDFIDGYCQSLPTGETNKAMLIVSHMPLVSYLVGELTQSQHAPLFPTAGLVEINYDTEKMRGEMVKMISPFDLALID